MKNLTFREIHQITLIPLSGTSKRWWLLLLGLSVGCGLGAVAWVYQINHGLEWSGNNHPIGWGIYITNFVFWIGIAHAGTLISAILYLIQAPFRTSISRIAEAMTIIAIITAGLFPIIHLGRALYVFWLFPYPNQRELWINFKSPLVWDLFAIMTYLIVSVIFFWLGLVPDVASVQSEKKGTSGFLYKILSLGFKGTSTQWLIYSRAYFLIAALAAPLVISVHSIVSWDFAVSNIPGWHSTIFAPYFVAGAIFSGCAMVLSIVIPLRKIYKGFDRIIQVDHLASLAKIMIFTSLILSYTYLIEWLSAWISGHEIEKEVLIFRNLGDYRSLFLFMLICNSVVPLFYFNQYLRRHTGFLFFSSVIINIGMWLERFGIVTSSLAHDFNPSNWGTYQPEWIEIWITIGSLSFFFLGITLFIKTLPSMAMSDLKEQYLKKND